MKSIIQICIVLFLLLIIPVSGEGFTTKSISCFGIESNNAEVASGNCTLDLMTNGGQTVTGQWQNLNGLNLTMPLQINIGRIKETLNYAILNQGVVYKDDSHYIDAPSVLDGAVCPSAPAYCYPVNTNRMGVGYDRVIVVDRVPAGSYGSFGNPDVSWSGNMSISLNGTQYSQKIGSGEEARGAAQFHTKEGEWIANAVWVGSLVSGTATPNQNGYVATHALGGSWNIAPKPIYDVYLKSLSDTDTKLDIWKGYPAYAEMVVCNDEFCSDVVNLVTIHNNNVDKLLSANTKIDYGSVTSTPVSKVGLGNVVDVIDRTIAYPELLVTIRASHLGIIVSTGTPQIESVEAVGSASGDNSGYVKVSVKNIGAGQGTFNVRMSGSKEVQVTLAPEEVKSVSLFFDDSFAGSREGTVEVYDVNTGVQDTREYQLNVSQAKTFIPNTEIVYNDVVSKSDDTGMNTTQLMDCTNGVFKGKDGKLSCIELANVAPPEQSKTALQMSTVPQEIPQKLEGGLYGWLLIVLIFIILLLYVLEKIINRQSGGLKRKNVIGAGMLKIILALAIVLLFLTVLWPLIESRINEMFFTSIYEQIYNKVKL